MLDWVQDHFSQVGLDILKSTNVLPGRIWDLNDGLTERGWVALTRSELEVLIGHAHGIEDLSVDMVVVDVD